MKYRFVYRGDELGLQFKRFGLWHTLLPYSLEATTFIKPFTCGSITEEWLLERLVKYFKVKNIYGEEREI
jgi:hypothetical protein